MAHKSRQSSGSSTTTSVNYMTATGTGTEAAAGQPYDFPPAGPETIEVEQVLGLNMAQRVVEFSATVPDPKPDIEQIIDAYVRGLTITSVDVLVNRVIVRGSLTVKFLYVAAEPCQSVHAFEQGNVRWTRDIEIDGAAPDMKASADAVVEYINYDFDPAAPRDVYVTIVLKAWARVITTTQMEVYPATPFDQTGAGEMPGYAPGPTEVEVSGPGITPTAGTNMAVAGTATVTGTRVNVRTGPGTNFPVITQVNTGDVVTLKDQAFGWYKVVLSDGNTTGWIAGWLLNVGAPKG